MKNEKQQNVVYLKKFSPDAGQPENDKNLAKLSVLKGKSSNAAIGEVTLISISKKLCPDFKKTVIGADVDTLSKMELRHRYKREADSHRNMLTREKSHGAIIHPSFRKFTNFLRAVGPMPAPGATLDRIDHTDPEYAPGKVRWADRRTQNNNKSDTIIFQYSRTGETCTASRLAKLQNVSTSAIRHRKDRGWTDDEIIEGKRLTPENFPHVQVPTPEPQRVIEKTGNPFADWLEKLNRPVVHPTKAELARSEREWLVKHYKECREEDGTEAFPPSIEDFNDGSCIIHLTQEQYDRSIARQWPEHRDLVWYHNLPVSQQQTIQLIDPDYVNKVTIIRLLKIKALGPSD